MTKQYEKVGFESDEIFLLENYAEGLKLSVSETIRYMTLNYIRKDATKINKKVDETREVFKETYEDANQKKKMIRRRAFFKTLNSFYADLWMYCKTMNLEKVNDYCLESCTILRNTYPNSSIVKIFCQKITTFTAKNVFGIKETYTKSIELAKGQPMNSKTNVFGALLSCELDQIEITEEKIKDN